MRNNIETLKFLMFVKNNPDVKAALASGDLSALDSATQLDPSDREELTRVDWKNLEIAVDDDTIEQFRGAGSIGNTVAAAAFVKTTIKEFFA